MPRARTTLGDTQGERNGRDRPGSDGTDRLGGPPPEKPARDGATPATAPRAPLPAAQLRLLKYGQEIGRRVVRRMQRYLDVRAERVRLLPEWANERDIDLRIGSGDPVAVSDALRDAAEALIEAAEAWEREHRI